MLSTIVLCYILVIVCILLGVCLTFLFMLYKFKYDNVYDLFRNIKYGDDKNE